MTRCILRLVKVKMIAPQWASQWCPNTTAKGTDYTGEFACGTKYGPNNTKTGKTGKAAPVSSGYCMGSACDKKNNVTLFCMAKGTEMGDHTSTKTAFVYVIEGEGIFTLAGKEIKMLPGTFIQMEENAVHSLAAIKNTSFMLYLN